MSIFSKMYDQLDSKSKRLYMKAHLKANLEFYNELWNSMLDNKYYSRAKQSLVVHLMKLLKDSTDEIFTIARIRGRIGSYSIKLMALDYVSTNLKRDILNLESHMFIYTRDIDEKLERFAKLAEEAYLEEVS